MDTDEVSSPGSLGGDIPEVHPSTGCRQDETSATDHQQGGPDIRIGPSGNPVGSVGLILDATNKMVERGSKPQFLEKALEGGEPETAPTSPDDLSSSTGDASVFSQTYPLEVSTENGGVSALLPSGQLLMDKNVSDEDSRDTGNGKDSSSIDDKERQVESGGNPETTPDECDAGEPKDPQSSGNCHNIQDSPPPELSNAIGMQHFGGTDLVHAQSSISENPTFNSYAPSELSTMLSNLEIQQLLIQGRQQQLEIDEIEGQSKNDKKKANMVLYANQSVYCRQEVEQSMAQRQHGQIGSVSQGTAVCTDISPIQVDDSVQDNSSLLPSPPVLPLTSSLSRSPHAQPPPQLLKAHVLKDVLEDENTSLPHVHYTRVDEDESTLGSEYMILPESTAHVQVLGPQNAVANQFYPANEQVLGPQNAVQDQFYPHLMQKPPSSESVSITSTITSMFVSPPFPETTIENGQILQQRNSLASESSSNATGNTSTPIVIEEDNSVEIVASVTSSPVEDAEESSNSLPKKSSGHSSESAGVQTEDALVGAKVTPVGSTSFHDDGYSADESGYDLYASNIDEFSECADLQQSPAIDESMNSRIRGRFEGGFGHVYDTNPLPAMSTKPVMMPPSFPSLMDSSVNSMVSETSRECSAAEEREDTLLAKEAYFGLQSPHMDPLAASSVNPRSPNDYERRYIVDLERINEAEESSASSSTSPRKARRPAASTVSATPPMRTVEESGNDEDADNAKTHATRRHAGNDHPHPPPSSNDFFNYRHQYYMEQYHYVGEQFKPHPDASSHHDSSTEGDSRTDDDTHSTCSSVTLSQAFNNSNEYGTFYETDSVTSDLTEDFSHSDQSRALSAVSSVTLSKALSIDRHDHSGQGMFVATRLGDYVEVPNKEESDEAPEPDEEECPVAEDGPTDATEGGNDIDVFSETAPGSSGSRSGSAGDSVEKKAAAEKKAVAQINKARADDVELSLIDALVPGACGAGAALPRIAARAVAPSASRGVGGVLLPWHSTRSIQNYQSGGRRSRGRRSTARSSDRSILSTSSVHTFRG